ncbi:acyltransferase family protein [Beijerinckia indica]|uniref:Acyltransferase 3 n=1 Tax=Beijerinckia indica subsp. indica (strain ATCC 9039 / DSM 1715 / NCIMB 8712) TaxID=395963 RepID=B2IJB4_BEII9|nr:acyltransferase 3 [Beijerinckia indica subsp. indica ATCC 9039]
MTFSSNENHKIIRFEGIDSIKAYAIILVVLGHVIRGLCESKIVHNNIFIDEIDNSIYMFHMPIFFFISGLLFYISGSYNRKWEYTLNKQFYTLIWPYLFWSICTVFIKVLLANSVNHPFKLSYAIKIIYDPIDQFWFLYTLLIIQILSKFIINYFGSNILFLISCIMFFMHFSFDINISVFSYVTAFLIYFVIGFLCGSIFIKNNISILHNYLFHSIFVFLLFQYFSIIIPINYNSIEGRLLSIPILLSFFVISITCTSKGNYFSKIMDFIGKNTLSIYCIHVIITAAIRIFLNQAGIKNIFVHIVTGTIGGVLIPLLILVIARRLQFSALIGIDMPQKPRSFKNVYEKYIRRKSHTYEVK